jgi:3-phenylpropionate/trans-cinnamate dioxygenase ferredoxin subunit
MPPSRRFIVAKSSDIAEGERRLVTVGGREVVLFRQDGTLYGLINACPHRAASLSEGRFQTAITSTGVGEYELNTDRRLLACPWHGWEFDITTGQSYLPAVKARARRYPVEELPTTAALADVEAGTASFTPEAWAKLAGGDGAGGEAGSDDGAVDDRIPGPYRAESVTVSENELYIMVDMAPPRPARQRPARPESD